MEEYQHPLDAAEEDEEYEEDLEDITENNDVLLNALIDLLITKGVITEDEFNKKVEEFTEDEEDMEEQIEGEELERSEHPTEPHHGHTHQNPY